MSTSIAPWVAKSPKIASEAGNIISLLTAKYARIQNRYEAGRFWQGGRRSRIDSYVNDARFDADQATRQELVRKARYFEQNSALVQRIADIWEQYTVGANGLVLLPDSSDDVWNKNAADWLETWAQYPDLVSLQSWPTLQGLISRTWFIDGEVFILKTRGKTAPYYPRVQLIESHRVGTPAARLGDKNIIDGVQIDGNGRPEAYWVQTGFDAGEYRPIDAKDMIHVFEPARVGMLRGIPHLYAVMNKLHDLDDREILQMGLAKKSSETSHIVKTLTGELVDEKAAFERRETSESGAANPLYDYYKEVFGSNVKVMKVGDEYEQTGNDRPSASEQWYWRYLSEQVCTGSAGIPLVMVYPESLQGTSLRGTLDMAAIHFRSRSKVIESASRDAITYVLRSAAAVERKLADKPGDWFKLACRPPKTPNVDVGRNSAAALNEIKAGARTLQSWYAELGEDWKVQLRQRAKEAAFIKELATEFEVAPEVISEFALQEQPPVTAPTAP